MLISMPTGTSTIFGVFQAINVPPNQFGADLTPKPNLEAGRESRKCANAVLEH